MVKAGRPPDIAQIGSYADYAARGKLYSADELLSIPVQADFLSALAQAGTSKRVQYGMPFAASTRLLFYNKTLFAEAGLDPDAPPRTWDELARRGKPVEGRGREDPVRAAARTGGGAGRGADVDAQRRRLVHRQEERHLRHRLRRQRQDLQLAAGQPRQQKPDRTSDPARTDRQDVFDAFARGEVGMLNGHPSLMEQAAAGA